MKTIKIYFCMVVFALVLMFSSKANAVGSISLSSIKSSVTVGDEFSISVNLSGASVATLTARVKVDTSLVDYVSGPANSSFSNGRAIYTWTDPTGGENPKTSGTIVTFKFKAKKAGKASFSVSGDFYSPDEENVNPSFSGTSVTIKEKETTTPTPTPTPTPPSNNTGGGSGGGTTGGGTTGGGTSSGTGNTGGSTGGSSSGNTGGSSGGNSGGTGGSTTTLSTNANLKELHLDVEGLSPAFKKTTTNYNIVVPFDRASININAIPEDSKAKVTITGNTNLQVGVNRILIKVVAEDKKTSKTYTINATKTDNPDLANANLENLAIENVVLNPEFNRDVFEYTASVPNEVQTLNILAVPQIEGASVTIEGNENLVVGENTIKIRVVAKDGVTVREYIVRINKLEAEPVSEEIENLDVEQEQEQQIEVEENNTGNLVFALIVAVSTGGVIFILVRKYRRENIR